MWSPPNLSMVFWNASFSCSAEVTSHFKKMVRSSPYSLSKSALAVFPTVSLMSNIATFAPFFRRMSEKPFPKP
uniref:Uncharacterized protein n=1 Tax=Anguilla anguilla TaxID=7936 RepID=A0A0E9XQI6_ANGAN